MPPAIGASGSLRNGTSLTAVGLGIHLEEFVDRLTVNDEDIFGPLVRFVAQGLALKLDANKAA